MTAPRGPSSQSIQVVRNRPDPLATLALMIASAFLVIALAMLWRSLVDRLRTEEAFDATLAETASRYQLLQLDEGTLRQQLEAAERGLSDLRIAIPSAEQAQAELSRYARYAAESGVGAGVELSTSVRRQSGDPATPELVVQRWRIEVRGPADNVMSFLDRIATGRSTVWRIENLVLRPDDSPMAGEWDVLATADVVVYSYAP